MVAHRIFSWMAISLVILIVSCSAPAAQPSAPTQPAPPPTEVTLAPTQPVPSPTEVTAAPTQPVPPPTEVTAVPTEPPPPPTEVTATPGSPTPGGDTTTLNMDEIFPPGPGRQLVLDNCTTCHTFVPIVVLQMTPEQWERNARDHRDRVLGLTDEEFKILYEYVTKNFNPDHPVPQLPEDLLTTWTSY